MTTPISRRRFLRAAMLNSAALALAVHGGPAALVRAQTETPNLIARENALPGATDWQLDPERVNGTIAGYPATSSVNLGGTLDLFVQSAGPFTLRVYRSGYYGGAGARLMLTQDFPAQRQPAPQIDHGTGLASCGNWQRTTQLTIAPNWVSGVYLVKLIRQDAAGENHCYFVVRDDDRPADILYQQSVTTYHAYNNFGGKSLYNFNSSLCETVAGARQAVKVSLLRPYAEIARPNFNDTYLNVEYPLVRWLEEQGFDMTYCTNMDTHSSGLAGARNRLLEHKVFISGGHDEYWSDAMRAAVTAARDAGTSLCFFGANTAYWRIRLEDDPWGGAPQGVIVCYKTAENGTPDPSGVATSTWRDPRGPNAPENALLGVQYIGDHDSYSFPLEVTAEQARDRAFRHTGLAALPAGTAARLGTQLVGWEWDAVTGNGLTPANLTILAASPVFGALLQGASKRYNVQQATVHTTRYTAASGAQVFASGTNQWSWGLALHDVDQRVQQMTCNILVDMGAVPATPAATLVLDARPRAVPPAAPLPGVSAPEPQISGLTAAVQQGKTRFSWTTNVPTTGQVWLGTAADAIGIVPYTITRELTTAHTITLDWMPGGTTYYFRAVSADQGGRVAFSETPQFTTLPDPIRTRATLAAQQIAATPTGCWARREPASVGAIIGLIALGGAGGALLLRRRARRAQHAAQDAAAPTAPDTSAAAADPPSDA